MSGKRLRYCHFLHNFLPTIHVIEYGLKFASLHAKEEKIKIIQWQKNLMIQISRLMYWPLIS